MIFGWVRPWRFTQVGFYVELYILMPFFSIFRNFNFSKGSHFIDEKCVGFQIRKKNILFETERVILLSFSYAWIFSLWILEFFSIFVRKLTKDYVNWRIIDLYTSILICIPIMTYIQDILNRVMGKKRKLWQTYEFNWNSFFSYTFLSIEALKLLKLNSE